MSGYSHWWVITIWYGNKKLKADLKWLEATPGLREFLSITQTGG